MVRGTGGYRDTGVPERELRRYKVSTSYYRRLVLKLRQKTLNVVFKTQYPKVGEVQGKLYLNDFGLVHMELMRRAALD